MAKKRKLPTFLMIVGFLTLVLAAMSIPSVPTDDRLPVILVGATGVVAILSGIVLSFRKIEKR